VAEHWLGQPLPDQALFEQYLPLLLRLRKLRRDGAWPDTPLHHEIAERLGADRYLSIRFVYQQHTLFEQLIAEHP